MRLGRCFFFFFLISPWHWLCPPLHGLDIQNVLCEICSFPWLIAFSLWCEGSPVLACCLLWWSSQWETCHILAIVNHPLHLFNPETWHLYLLTGFASHTPTNLYAWFLQRGFTAIFVPPTAAPRELEAPCIPAAAGHWVNSIEAVQLSVSRLMDGLSDFIWAGRTLCWLGPRDCHSWLLYQGLTYRAVILFEQGSQAPRPAIRPSCLSHCHPGTLACLLDWPDACLTPTRGQIH